MLPSMPILSQRPFARQLSDSESMSWNFRDELPQLIDILIGDMSFVGTRPEAVKYVKQYSKEMYATLLLLAGITSEASIRYKDEATLLDGVDDVDKVYLEEILPEKMKYNLKAIREYSFIKELQTMIRTIFAVLQEGV